MFGRNVNIYNGRLVVTLPSAEQYTDSTLTQTHFIKGRSFVYEQNSNGQWELKQVLQSSDSNVNYSRGFDYVVTQWSNYIMVGFPVQQSDSASFYKSAVYVFRQNGNGVWEEVQKISPPNINKVVSFGNCIAVSDSCMFIGAGDDCYNTVGDSFVDYSGAVYSYKLTANGQWVFEEKIVASDRGRNYHFGSSISMEGGRAVIGSLGHDHKVPTNPFYTKSYAGAAYYLKKQSNGKWKEMQRFSASDKTNSARFGEFIALSKNNIVVGAPWEDTTVQGITIYHTGSVYTYQLDTVADTVIQMQKMVPKKRGLDTHFGSAVSIDGDYILVGKNSFQADSGEVILYRRNSSGIWKEEQIIRDSSANEYVGRFGSSVSINNGKVIIGSLEAVGDEQGGNAITAAGAAYAYNVCEPVIAYSQTTTICLGDSAFINGYWYKTADSYYKLLGKTLAGCDSVTETKLVVLPNAKSTVSQEICKTDSVLINNKWRRAGVYRDTLQTALGCDSIVTLVLGAKIINTSVTRLGNTLTANNATADTYWWYDCDAKLVLAGQNKKSFTPTKKGDYAVIISQQGCSDTSACISFSLLSVESIGDVKPSIYPNPATNILTIDFGISCSLANIQLYNTTMSKVAEHTFFDTQKIDLPISQYPQGLYILHVTIDNSITVFKLVIQ